MTHDYKPARVAGPFGYSQRNLAALTPEERDAMRRELDALDTKLQWGFEPGRWATGAAWHNDDWPEPRLLGAGELAGGFERRDDLIVEAGDFRATLDGADKAWKTEVGLNSPFLPALAAKPRAEREQMRERGKAIRDLVAFGETPERWAQGIGYLRDDLRDPDSDTERLIALHGQRTDLLPAVDAMDHALDYLDEVDAEGGADSPDAPADGNVSGGYTPLPEPGSAGPRGDSTGWRPGMIPDPERSDGEYPSRPWAAPTPGVMSPEYSAWLADPSTPWSRLADGWRRAWTRLGPVYRRPEDFPGRRYLPDSTGEPPVDFRAYGGGAALTDPEGGVRNAVYRPVPGQANQSLVTLMPYIEPPEGAPPPEVQLLDAKSGDSSAPAQPASGSADGSPTGGGDGSIPASPGSEGQGSETPAPGLRPAPGINPRAGTDGQAQSGSFVTQAIGTLDSALLPAEFVGDKSAAEFQARTGYGIQRSKDGLVLTYPSGNALFDLPEDSAAELARSRDPDVIRRMDTLGVLWREDIAPAEKRRLIEQEIFRDVPEALRGAPVAALDWTSMEGGDPTDFRLRAAESKLKAYDDLAAALEAGASGEEMADRLGAFQAAMLPEAFGSERFLRDLVKDVMPGLGNLRSIRHLQNDISEIDRAIESGEWGDAAYASGMAILDTVGIFPGVNALKGLAKGAAKAIPRAGGLLAERSIRRLARQWDVDVGKVDPRRFFGDALDALPPDLQQRVKGLVNNSVGRVSEREMLKLGKRMDPKATDQVVRDLPKGQGFPTESRRYDMDALLPSEVLAARNDTLGRIARRVAGAGDEMGPASKAEVKQFELKTGGGSRSTDQRKVDQTFRDNPELAKDHDVNQIVDLRKAPGEVPIKSVIDDLSAKLDTWVSKGSLPRDQADALQRVMRQMQAKGIETIRLEDYAGLLARLGAAPPRRLSPDGGAIMDGPMGMS